MLLTGTFKRAVDDKLRIAIPKRFRDCFQASESQSEDKTGDGSPATAAVLYIAPGTDGSLTLYTEAAFTRLADQLDHASPTGKDVRAFSRLFFSRAESVDVDKQGRIRIPTELAELATIETEAMLIGVRDRIEIWDTKRWQAYIAANEKEYDALAEKALDSK